PAFARSHRVPAGTLVPAPTGSCRIIAPRNYPSSNTIASAMVDAAIDAAVSARDSMDLLPVCLQVAVGRPRKGMGGILPRNSLSSRDTGIGLRAQASCPVLAGSQRIRF